MEILKEIERDSENGLIYLSATEFYPPILPSGEIKGLDEIYRNIQIAVK
ncbi:MAG: hypothetical protein SVR08_01910 [Spirochaetota bacterium]|nr:hypothetical protein [Spirochaetota bacterium]